MPSVVVICSSVVVTDARLLLRSTTSPPVTTHSLSPAHTRTPSTSIHPIHDTAHSTPHSHDSRRRDNGCVSCCFRSAGRRVRSLFDPCMTSHHRMTSHRDGAMSCSNPTSSSRPDPLSMSPPHRFPPRTAMKLTKVIHPYCTTPHDPGDVH